MDIQKDIETDIVIHGKLSYRGSPILKNWHRFLYIRQKDLKYEIMPTAFERQEDSYKWLNNTIQIWY